MKTMIAIFMTLLIGILMGSGIAEAASLQMLPTVLLTSGGLVVAGAYTPVSNALGVVLTDIRKSSRFNMGGGKVILYYGLHDDVATWPTLPDQDTATMEEASALTGDVVMSAGKRMFELYGTMNTVGLDYELVGDLDGKSYKHMLSLNHPGMAAKLLGFMAAAANENLFFIFLRHDGSMYMVGSEGFPAMQDTSNGGSGKAVEDGAKTEMTFISYGYTPAPIYTGSVPLTAAASGSGS